MVGPREVIWLSQLTETQLQAFYESAPVFIEADIDYPNRRLAAYLQSQNIPTIDLQRPMLEYMAETGAPLYLPIDRHWTVGGNRLVAELIFTWLVDNNLVVGSNHAQ